MSSQVYAVIDVGGTKLLLLLIDPCGNVVYRKKLSTAAGSDEGGYMVKRINDAVKKGLKAHRYCKGALKGMGLCLAALVDLEGNIHSAPNLPWLPTVNIKELMHEAWSVPVAVENDCNAAVVGEVFGGAARGLKNVIYVTVSTGIGAGFFLEGRLYRGARGFAAELGHTGPYGSLTCNCGGVGCLESEASGNSIARKGEKELKVRDTGAISTADVFSLAGEGEVEAVNIVDEATDKLGLSFANLVTLLDPEAIVVGGGVSAEGERLLNKIRENMVNYSFNPGAREVRILRAALEPESGAWGMYRLIKEKVAALH